MKKAISILLALMLMVSVFAGCSSAPAESASTETETPASESTAEETTDETEEPAEVVELTFTSVSVPTDEHTEAMYVFADKVAELTNGSLIVNVYDSGSLFSGDGEYDALVNGDADIAYVSFPTIATQLPKYSMFGSGYFFSSYEHMTSTLNGEIATEVIYPEIESELGLKPLGALYLGSRVINTRNKEINSYADMDGVLLRMPNSETWLFLGEALGANPTPLAFSEVYTSLQTGAIDAQDNPLPTVESAKFYEVTEYLAITNHVVDSIMPTINLETWNELSAEHQAAVQEAMTAAIQHNDEARIAREAELIAFFEAEGLTVTYPDIDEFKTNVQAKYQENTEMISTWDMDMYDQVQALAE